MTNLVTLPIAAVPPGTRTARTEFRMYEGAGGRRLAFQVVEARPTRHHLLYVHGIESHGGWFLPAALRLREHGCTTWLLDRRGSGLNRDVDAGDAASAAILLEDVRRARERMGDPPVHLVGLSWGGKLATAAALDRPQHVASLILVAPGLRARVDLTLGQKLAVGLSMLGEGRRPFPVPIRPEMFTRDPRLLDFIRNDPLRVTAVTARFLMATRALDRRIRKQVADLRVPVLLMLAENDEIVDNDAVLRLLAPLPPGRLRVRHHAQAMHSLQLERPGDMVDDIVAFLGTKGAPW